MSLYTILPNKRKTKIALSLRGGAIKATLHMGAVRVFQDNGLDFDLIGGLSGGSVIASVYAL